MILPITAQGRGARSACSTYCKALARRAARADATPAAPVRGRDRRARPARRREDLAVDQEGRARSASRSGRATSTSDSVFMARRDTAPKEKAASAARRVRGRRSATMLDEIQDGLFARAQGASAPSTRARSTARTSSTRSSRRRAATSENAPTPIHGGFALTHFSATPSSRPRSRTTSTSPCAASRSSDGEPGTCPFTGKPSAQRVVWAKAY